MYGREKRVLLREYLKDGWSKEELARKLGISRRTLYYWISTDQLDRDLDVEPVRYSERPPVERKIDRYLEIIHARLDAYPKLSAVRLFEEIHAAGYEGSYTQVKEYVRQVRPSPEPEPVVRFETPPGHQGQVDFAHFRLPWGRMWALVVVLSFSRLLWVRFFHRQDMRTLFSGIEQAFRFFGGVTVELLFDQLKAVIIEDGRADGGALVENIEFLRFANHWGFRIRACRPYRAKTKGKVERPIRYLRENFFYGREFLNEADLDAQLWQWLNGTANLRIHGTTRERPAERFERQEKALLGPLAAKSYLSLKVPQQTGAARGLLTPELPRLVVERRPLEIYSQLVGGCS